MQYALVTGLATAYAAILSGSLGLMILRKIKDKKYRAGCILAALAAMYVLFFQGLQIGYQLNEAIGQMDRIFFSIMILQNVIPFCILWHLLRRLKRIS